MFQYAQRMLYRVRNRGTQFLHSFGIHCATHQIRVILISCVVITSLFYPALAIYSSSQPQLLAQLSSQILDPFLERDTIAWYHYKNDLRHLWVGHDALRVHEDAVARARCGTGRTLRVERVLIRSSTPEDAGALTHQTLLATLNLERRLSHTVLSEGISCVMSRDGQCFVASPLAFWNHNEHTLLGDTHLLDTINHGVNTTVSDVPLTLEMTLAGRELCENSPSAIEFSMFLALTFFFPDNDCSGDTGHTAWLQTLNRVASQAADLTVDNQEPSLISLEYNTQSSKTSSFSIITVFLYLAYIVFFLVFSGSMKRMASVHSRIGLAFTGLIEIVVSTITSLSVCAIVGFKVTMVPWGILPVVIVFVGAENMFRLVDAVVKTPVSLSVKQRIAEGLSVAGMSNTLRVVSYNAILGIISVFAVGAIRQFCVFAIVVLVAHWFLVHTFFIAVLSIDLQRLELDELLTLMQGSTMSPVPPSEPPKAVASASQSPFKRAMLRMRNVLGGRAMKNVSLLLLLAITATLYYATYPSTPRLAGEDRVMLNRGGSPRVKPANPRTDTFSPAWHVWKTLNPTEDPPLHLRVESPTYLTFRPTKQDVKSSETRPHAYRSAHIRPLLWILKIVVLPITVTTGSLYALLLYLLKDTERLDVQRSRAEPDAEESRDPNPVEGDLSFTTLPRAFATDVELIAVSKDGSIVAAVSSDNEVVVWRTEKHVSVNVDVTDVLLRSASTSSVSSRITSVAVDDDGRFCAVGTGAGIVAIWVIGETCVSPLPHLSLNSSSFGVTEMLFVRNEGPAERAEYDEVPCLLALYETGIAVQWRTSSACPMMSYISPSHPAATAKCTFLRPSPDTQPLVAFFYVDGIVELLCVSDVDDTLGTDCLLVGGSSKDPATLIHGSLIKLDGTRRLIVAISTEYGAISLWDAGTQECILVLDDAYPGINALRLSNIPSKPCSQCGQMRVDSFCLSFSLGQVLIFFTIYLSAQLRRCTCPINQPPGHTSSSRESTIGRRSRSGSIVPSLSAPSPSGPRSRNPSFSNLSSVTTSAFPVSGHGVHSRRGSEKDMSRRTLDLSIPLDEDGHETVLEIRPQNVPMATSSTWQNLVVARSSETTFERGQWDVLSSMIVGLRRKRRPPEMASTLTALRSKPDSSRGLSLTVLERWEFWTFDPSGQPARVRASPLATLEPTPHEVGCHQRSKAGAGFRSAVLSRREGSIDELPRLPFTRISPLVIGPAFCIAGFGNTLVFFEYGPQGARERKRPPAKRASLDNAEQRKKSL